MEGGNLGFRCPIIEDFYPPTVSNSPMESKPKVAGKATCHAVWCLVMVSIVAILPQAFAQTEYTDINNPTGPLMSIAWTAGMVVAGVSTGIGVWAAVRKH